MTRKILRGLTLSFGISIIAASSAFGITYGSEETEAATKSPWVVLILHYPVNEEEPDYICTGTLIKPSIVLTAGHCVDPKGTFQVKYGITTFDEAEKAFTVSGAWRSPRYSAARFGVNDIGLLKLKQPIPGAITVPLASAANLAKAEKSKDFKVFGWGENQNGEIATYLRVANVTNQSALLKKVLGKSFNSNTWLAAGRYISKEKIYSGACRGDSGGPLVASLNGKLVQVGITSFGAQDCDTSVPTIFMRLSYYLKDLAIGINQLSTNALLVDRSLPENTELPSITGSAEVGSTLDCQSGKWTANAKQIDFAWLFADGTLISRTRSIQVTKDLAGEEISCSVFATSSAGTTYKTIDVKIDESIPAAITQPSIKGSPKVFGVLQCDTGSWNKFTTGLTVRWTYEGSSYSQSDKVVFAVPEEAAGRTITCEVTGSGIVSSVVVKTSVLIPAKPVIVGSAQITGLPTSGYGAGKGITVLCSGSSATGEVESTEYSWWLRDYATGSTATKISTGNQFSLPNGFFEQNKGRVLLCGFTAIGPGGIASSFDVETIVTPRLPEAPSVQVNGFTTWGANADAWVDLPISCKVDSYIDSTVPKSISVEWRIYESNSPYYPLATTPSTFLANGVNLTLTKAILDKSVLKGIGCAATVTTATGSATAYSTKTYVDYRNIVAADTTAPTIRLVKSPTTAELKLGIGGYFDVEISDAVGVGKYPISGIKVITPLNTEAPSSGGFLPELSSGNDKVGIYGIRVSLPTKASGGVAGEYKLLLSIFDAKSNWTGWITASVFSVTE
jgi:V8-like Glu-specific endopeptidase